MSELAVEPKPEKTRSFDAERIKADFPILQQKVNGYPLVYLDNAATTQKPQCVIDKIVEYYTQFNANVHRGAHALSDKATAEFERARQVVASFIGSAESKQVIWTRGATEAINLVANTWGEQNIRAGQKILISTLEHHSNIVPWQMLAEKKDAEIVPLPLTDAGELDLDAYEVLLDEDVALVCVAHVSNALGTVNPVQDIVKQAKRVGAKVLVDGAQAIAHYQVNVQSLGCDFYVFSGHKVFAPTGIGVLWADKSLLETMPPWHGGGEMIATVSFDKTTYADLPYKFEAGTPNIEAALGLAAALEYLDQFDRSELLEHENAILSYCIERSADIDGLQRIGRAARTASVFSFVVDGTHPSDIGALLDQQGVAVRTGHHCTQPLMQSLALPGTARASFSIYNTKQDVDRFVDALHTVLKFLR